MPETIQIHRELTHEEMRLVRWLLENGWGVTQDLVNQLENLKVVSECSCGCASINFVEHHTGLELISEAEFRNQDGGLVGVLLFASGDRLAELETYSKDGSDVDKEIPHVNELTLWSSLDIE